MIYNFYQLRCDQCSKEYKESMDSCADLRKYSKQNDWTKRKDPNGSYWDLCPKCSLLNTKKLR